MTQLPPFLQSERLHLRALTEADADGAYVEWFNDEKVCRGNSHHVFPFTREAALEYICRVREARDQLVLAIVLRADERHIGNIALQNIHPIYRAAEFSIVLGDKTLWGQRYSQEAGRLLCAHGFDELNLHRIYCGTFADNMAMQKLALGLGMREEGRRREAAFKHGRFLDVVEYGMVKADFDVARQRWRKDLPKE